MPGPRPRPSSTELNLLPMLNMISVIIPFLIMGAQVSSLAVVDARVDEPGLESSTDGSTPRRVAVTLSVGRSGLRVSTMGGGEGMSADLPCRADDWCTDADDYDWAELTAVLARVKDVHPAVQDLLLVPEASVRYEILIRAMDASREDTSSLVDGRPRRLFPSVTIASEEP
jgi:hypothetical protein